MFAVFFFFFFKQKTAYEMRISDWSSDVCSSDLRPCACLCQRRERRQQRLCAGLRKCGRPPDSNAVESERPLWRNDAVARSAGNCVVSGPHLSGRSEEHTSELQSLMRISYAVFCLQKRICK